MKKLLATTYGVIIGAVLCAGLLFVATLMPIPGNVQIKVVKSGSMEPAIRTGSIVAIRPAASYKVGDVITFGKDTKTQIPTTHRIVGIEGVGASATYTTRGDANDTADQVVTRISDIRGKVLFTVPFAGYALAFARTKLGFFLLVGVPALFVFVEEGFAIYKELARARRRKMRSEREEEAEEVVRSEMRPARAMVRSVPQRIPDTRPRKVMGTLVILAGVATAASGSVWGSTVAYYANTATSQGNSLSAGVFDVPAPQQAASFAALLVETSEPVVEDPPPAETPAAQEPQAETPAPEVPVEVSTTEATIE